MLLMRGSPHLESKEYRVSRLGLFLGQWPTVNHGLKVGQNLCRCQRCQGRREGAPLWPRLDLEIGRLKVERNFLSERSGPGTWPSAGRWSTPPQNYPQQRYLAIIKKNWKNPSLFARICVHCRTVHENREQVEPRPRCEGPICVSRMSSCRQNTCHRRSGSRNRGKLPDWLRR